MTLREHIAAIVSTMRSKPTFYYGSANDLNNLIDETTKWPVVFLLDIKPTTLSFTSSGAIAENNGTYMEFFKPVDMDDTAKSVDLVQAEMLTAVKDFLVKLNNYRVNGSKVFKIDTGDSAKSLNFTDKYDVNVAGQTLDISLKPMYQDSFC